MEYFVNQEGVKPHSFLRSTVCMVGGIFFMTHSSVNIKLWKDQLKKLAERKPVVGG